MTETELKLRDAATQMKLALRQPDDEEIVRSCVNSFISFGRSVTLVMQRESSAVPQLATWYDSRMQTLRERPHLRFFNASRVYSIHRGVIVPQKHTVPIQNLTINGVPQPGAGSMTFLQFAGAEEYFPGRSGGVFLLCEEYFLILRQLVHDWLSKCRELRIQ